MYKFSDITEKIIGASMRVHAALGNGFQEVIYQRALAVELEEINVNFKREMESRFTTKAGTLVKDALISL